MLGKPSSVKPVDMKFSPGPCVFVLLVSEWMKHISSASSPSCGSRSLVILPHSPRGPELVSRRREIAVLALERDELVAARHRLAVAA